MQAWDGWELGRAVVVFSAVLYAGIWAQTTMLHWRAAFRRWQMYAPVVAAPFIVLAAVLGVIERDGVLGWIAVGGFIVGVVEGLAGTYFHLQGSAYQVGGLLSLRNLIAGPPPLLPVAFGLTGIVGLMGMLWS